MLEKQYLMFPQDDHDDASKYNRAIDGPIYRSRGEQPHILSLIDDLLTKRMIAEIDGAIGITDSERAFLRAAAWRHTKFHYERIADYYAHATPEMRRLMERSALVILDFGSAIERGYVKLCSDIREQYLQDYANDTTDTT